MLEFDFLENEESFWNKITFFFYFDKYSYVDLKNKLTQM